jgi:GcvH upstream region-like protein
MLNFLRKYQKIVFGVVTAALIVSITFFGSYSAMTQVAMQEKDVILGKAIDGSKISKLHMEKMKRFLVSDQFDTDLYAAHSRPNIFNNGVIRKDLIQSGLANMIAGAFFDKIHGDLQARLEKQKAFKGYHHPAAPFLSSENLYAQFVPTLKDKLLKIRSEQFVITQQTLSDLFALYEEATSFPTEYVRRFLTYQQNQYEWLAKDPYLASGDLSLFYFHHAEDWFGPAFMQAATQVIHNVALVAKEKGMKVSFEESKNDLLKNGYEALKGLYQEKVTAEHLDQAWKGVLAQMHLTEKEMVAIWQDVLLFRKLFEEKGSSVLVDTFSQEQFHQFASESREIERYTLPESLAIKDFAALAQFETYVDAVCVKSKHQKRLDLPSNFKTVEEVSNYFPELVEKTYQMEYASLDLEELTSKLSLKEVWQWEVQEENFAKLRAKFKDLEPFKVEGDAQKTLDLLTDHHRFQVDKYAALEMIKIKHDLIQEELALLSFDKTTWKVALCDEKIPLKGITDTKELLELAEKSLNPENPQAASLLSCYTQDGVHFYKIKLLEKPSAPRILTFKEASSQKILDKLLDKKLKQEQKSYESAHLTEALKEDGSAKSFEMMRLDIAAHVYKPLLSELEKQVNPALLKDLTTKEKLDLLAKHRYLSFMSKAQQDIAELGEASLYLKKENLFYIESFRHLLKRKESKPWFKEEMFSLQQGQTSEVSFDGSNEVSFFKVLALDVQDKEDIAENIREKQQTLALEAKKELMSQLLDLFKEHQTVVFLEDTKHVEG